MFIKHDTMEKYVADSKAKQAQGNRPPFDSHFDFFRSGEALVVQFPSRSA